MGLVWWKCTIILFCNLIQSINYFVFSVWKRQAGFSFSLFFGDKKKTICFYQHVWLMISGSTGDIWCLDAGKACRVSRWIGNWYLKGQCPFLQVLCQSHTDAENCWGQHGGTYKCSGTEHPSHTGSHCRSKPLLCRGSSQLGTDLGLTDTGSADPGSAARRAKEVCTGPVGCASELSERVCCP